jgi:hypothetical protein
MLKEGEDTKSRLTYGFRSCVARMPTEREIERLTVLYQQQLSHFDKHPAEAEKVANNHLETPVKMGAAELAAWSMVANVLLNLDETLTKE